MTPVGFEPTISAGKRQHTYALDHVGTGTGLSLSYVVYMTNDTSELTD